jgi:hypothetical protein
MKRPLVEITTGFVGYQRVTAYVYPGNDRNLSHYSIEGGKSYFGFVTFSTISEKINKPY